MTKIPNALIAHGYGRSDEALAKIEKAKTEIRRDLKSGKLGRLRERIDRAYVIQRAGLNKDFLKGDRHKSTTKTDVQSFVDDINDLLRQSHPDPQSTIDELQAQVTEWAKKYERVSHTIHKWAGEVRKSRKEVRDLKNQLQLLADNAEIRVLPVISPRTKQ